MKFLFFQKTTFMKMNEYINDFTKHLKEALIIGKKAELNQAQSEIHNVLICGLGGSGIGGTIISDLLSLVVCNILNSSFEKIFPCLEILGLQL